jgi:hypothetical protein
MLNMKILWEDLESLCNDPGQIRITGQIYDAIMARAEVCCKASEDEEKTS